MENINFNTLALRAGIHFMGVTPVLQQKNVAMDFSIAMDAQPALVTVSNSGVPAFLTTIIDSKLIEVLVSPMKAAEIVGDEVKKGDWTTTQATFTVVESTGEVASYGDYSENGNAGVNTNFPSRQPYHYQVITQWGEKELDQAGAARIDWANRQNIASVLILNKFQNKSYFFGVQGLQNYGLLNDPTLSTPVVPTTKTAGGTTWEVATAQEVLKDIAKLYKQLQSQSNGVIDRDTKMVLAMSPLADGTGLTKVSEFNVSVSEQIKKLYPNLEVRIAPEYSTVSGELLQLMVEEFEGQRTAQCAFTEKLRAHPVVVGLSNFKQKKSQGTYGTIIYRPVFIAQMLGV